MAGFPFASVRGLGGTQITLGLIAMGLGSGDLVLAISLSHRYLGPYSVFPFIGTGIWTGLFFLIAGSLASSIRQGQSAGCKIGAAQTMSLLNTILFAPGLTTVATLGAVLRTTWYINSYDYSNNLYYYDYSMNYMFYIDMALAGVGGLEFFIAFATACVCCCGGPYNQPAANQVVPMPMMTYPAVQAAPMPAPRPSYGFAERPGTVAQPGFSAGGDGQMVTIPAAELGVLYANSKNAAE